MKERKKERNAQAYPRKYVHLVYLYIRAQGVGGGHNTRIETAVFFFCSGSFFFFLTQVRQVKVVFLRTLRNVATRLEPFHFHVCLAMSTVRHKTLAHKQTARIPNSTYIIEGVALEKYPHEAKREHHVHVRCITCHRLQSREMSHGEVRRKTLRIGPSSKD